MNLTDTHCHLDLEKFDPDREAVLERASQAGLTRILIPGLNLVSSQRVVDLARAHSWLYAAVGVHPNDALTWDGSSLEALRQLVLGGAGISPAAAGSSKIVAIGEIGLDYYWNDAPPDRQRFVLQEQLNLATELGLPVILHLREHADALDGPCAADLLGILTKWVGDLQQRGNPLAHLPGVLHSFSGSLETARHALDLGFYIGVTGPVTYKNADAKREVVKSLPLERLLIETDAPFLAPVPKRGLRNEPAFVRHIADKIAEIHNKNPEEIAEQTSTNAMRVFSWGG